MLNNIKIHFHFQLIILILRVVKNHIMKKILFSVAFAAFVSFANAQCQAGFTYSVSNDTVTLTDQSTFSMPMSYVWYFNMGSCGSINTYYGSTPPQVTGLYAGTYQVCLYLSDTMPSTCSSTFCDSVTIVNGAHPPCVASFDTWVDTAAPYLVHFINNYCYNSQWFWDFGDGTTSTDHYPQHQYAVNGVYTVFSTVITNAGDSCTFGDTINSTPCSQLLNVSFTHSVNNNIVTFTSNCSGSSISNPYYWSFEDGTTDNSTNPVHTFLYSGTYNVCLTYIGDNMGCSKTFCDTMTITGGTSYPCNALFSYMPDTMSTNSIRYWDLSSMNIVARSWSFPGGTPSTSTSNWEVVAYPAPGTYTAYLTVTNQSGMTCSYSNTVNVGSNCANTLAYFQMSPSGTPHVWNVVNMSTGTPPITYSWNWGDGSALSSGASPAHTYAQAGFYNICLDITDANGCGSSYCTFDSLYKPYSTESVISVFVTYPAGINNIPASSGEFSVYPNPATDNLTIITGQKAVIEILNIQGQLIKTFATGDNTISIDLLALPCGMYFIKMITENGTIAKKFVKE
jgi:PKD repeat protein